VQSEFKQVRSKGGSPLTKEKKLQAKKQVEVEGKGDRYRVQVGGDNTEGKEIRLLTSGRKKRDIKWENQIGGIGQETLIKQLKVNEGSDGKKNKSRAKSKHRAPVLKKRESSLYKVRVAEKVVSAAYPREGRRSCGKGKKGKSSAEEKRTGEKELKTQSGEKMKPISTALEMETSPQKKTGKWGEAKEERGTLITETKRRSLLKKGNA